MNIEEQIKIVKNMLLHAETQLLDYEAIAIETLLIAYEEKCKELEKEKEKNKIKFEKILADDLKVHIDRLIMGKSISYPCGWIYKRDLIELINDIKWE